MICYRRIANSLMAFLFASTAFAANPDADDNLSLMRQVRTSSCFDYNLTGQLLTDGIVTTAMRRHSPYAMPPDRCQDASGNGQSTVGSGPATR